MGPLRYTLLTGATGLLGRTLLADMFRARLPVAVLVRPGREGDASRRIEQLLRRFEESHHRTFPRPVVLPGELTREDLGLSLVHQRWLKHNCERILHSGASVSFKPAKSDPDNEPFRTNVEGTERLARFALSLGIREFHQISSAFSCGIRHGLVMETDGDCSQAFSNDYELSKRQSEDLLQGITDWRSLTIYRPSIVIDPTPASLPMGDRTIYLAFSVYQLLSQRVGLPDPQELLQQLGMTGAERKNIVPVDWVSRVTVQILRRPELHGRTYHLTHSTGTTLLEMLTAFRDVLLEQGYRPLKRRINDSDFGELSGVVHQFLGTFAPYFREDPQFDQTQIRQALAICGEPLCPDVNRGMLQELARQQLRQSSGVNAAGTARQSGTAKQCREPVWAASLPDEMESSERVSQLEESVSDTNWALSSQPHLHLILTGPNGGSWNVYFSKDGKVRLEPGASGTSTLSVYSSSQTWNQLLNREVCLHEVIRQGRVLLEVVPEERKSGECRNRNVSAIEGLEGTVERLINILREGIIGRKGVEKVSLHGT